MLIRVRRIRARSAFLLAMALYGIVGLLVGIVLGAVSRLEVPVGTEENVLNQLGLWSIIVFPLLFGLMAGVAAGTAAALYNAAAAITGGIWLDVPEVEPARSEEEAMEPRE